MIAVKKGCHLAEMTGDHAAEAAGAGAGGIMR